MVLTIIYYIIAAILMIAVAVKMGDIFKPLNYVVSDLVYCTLVTLTYIVYFILTLWVMHQIPIWVKSVSYIGTIVWLCGMNVLGYYIPEIITNHIDNLSSNKCEENNPKRRAICDVILCVALIVTAALVLSPLIGGKVPWR